MSFLDSMKESVQSAAAGPQMIYSAVRTMKQIQAMTDEQLFRLISNPYPEEAVQEAALSVLVYLLRDPDRLKRALHTQFPALIEGKGLEAVEKLLMEVGQKWV